MHICSSAGHTSEGLFVRITCDMLDKLRRGTCFMLIVAVLIASEPVAGMDHDEAAAADRWRKANLLSGAIARAAKSNKPLVISALQARHHRILHMSVLCI
jgi:hypothetical protein